ncbi:MAG: hypothetical protein LVQ95_03480 [Candidatus Micrarchaeales archaeon]|nr:hypothetical protein [Candidatus Micrarchaeales archaeon]
MVVAIYLRSKHDMEVFHIGNSKWYLELVKQHRLETGHKWYCHCMHDWLMEQLRAKWKEEDRLKAAARAEMMAALWKRVRSLKPSWITFEKIKD